MVLIPLNITLTKAAVSELKHSDVFLWQQSNFIPCLLTQSTHRQDFFMCSNLEHDLIKQCLFLTLLIFCRKHRGKSTVTIYQSLPQVLPTSVQLQHTGVSVFVHKQCNRKYALSRWGPCPQSWCRAERVGTPPRTCALRSTCCVPPQLSCSSKKLLACGHVTKSATERTAYIKHLDPHAHTHTEECSNWNAALGLWHSSTGTQKIMFTHRFLARGRQEWEVSAVLFYRRHDSVEHCPQCKTHDSVEHCPQCKTHDSVEHCPQCKTHDSVEHCPQCKTHDSVEHCPQCKTHDSVEHCPQCKTHDSVEHCPHYKTHDSVEHCPQCRTLLSV